MVILFTSGVCPLVGEAGLEAWLDFLAGGACVWWIELGHGTLVVRVISRVESRGSSGLRKILDRLSSHWWGCLFTPLFVWPMVSQHWSL